MKNTTFLIFHNDIIKWKHFPRYWPFTAQRPVARSFGGFFDLRLNKRLSKQSWAGDLGRHRAHYDVIVMMVANIDHGEVNKLIINTKGNVSVIKQPRPWVASHTFLCKREQRRKIDMVLTFSPSWHFSWGTFTYMTLLINVGQNTNTIVDPAYMLHIFQQSQWYYSAWKINKRQESLSAPCSLPLCRVALD